MFPRLTALLISIILPLNAQDEPAPKADKGGLQVKFLAEAAPADLGPVFLQFEEARSEPITLPLNHLSAPVAVSERLMVLKTVNKEIPLCKITLPELGKTFAIILVTAKAGGYQPIVVRTDDPSFKAGDVFFINRTGKTVLGKLGTTPLILKSGQTAKSRPTGPVDNTYYDIAFAVRDETGDKRISSSRWPIDEKLRSYVFFFTNGNGRTSFRAVDEYLRPGNKG